MSRKPNDWSHVTVVLLERHREFLAAATPGREGTAIRGLLDALLEAGFSLEESEDDETVRRQLLDWITALRNHES